MTGCCMSFLCQCEFLDISLLIFRVVQQIDALDPYEDLTELGRHLAELPVEPCYGKMILHSLVLKCLDPILTIACALAYKDPCECLIVSLLTYLRYDLSLACVDDLWMILFAIIRTPSPCSNMGLPHPPWIRSQLVYWPHRGYANNW